MGVGEVFVLHGLDLDGTFLSQVEDAAPSLNTRVINSYAAGIEHPLFHAVAGQESSISFSTTSIATLLGKVGQKGADTSSTNVDLYFKRATNKGTRTGGATGERFRVADSFTFWQSIRAGHQGNAVASGAVLPIWDGTNDPIVRAGSTAVSGTPAASELFTLGPVKINGSNIDGIQDVTISLGMNVNRFGSEGELYPTFAYCQTVQPVVTIRGTEMSDVWNLGTLGTALTNLTVYLRKKSQTTGNVADGTGQHISFVATEGVVYPESSGGGIGSDNTITGFRCVIAGEDSSTDPFTISTTATIT